MFLEPKFFWTSWCWWLHLYKWLHVVGTKHSWLLLWVVYLAKLSIMGLLCDRISDVQVGKQNWRFKVKVIWCWNMSPMA